MTTSIENYREAFLWDIAYCLGRVYFWQHLPDTPNGFQAAMTHKYMSEAANDALSLLSLEEIYGAN